MNDTDEFSDLWMNKKLSVLLTRPQELPHYPPGMRSSTQVLEFESTTNIVFVLILAILLSAVLVLGLVLGHQNTWTRQVLSKVSNVFVKYLALSQELEKWLK